MKRIVILGIAVAVLFSLIGGTALAAQPTTFTVPHNQAQFQWRGISAFGDWTPGYSYQTYLTSSDFILTGNVLHTAWSYSPLVTDLAGQSTVYVYDKKSGVWIEKEGTVSYKYVPGYGDYPIANYFRGYLRFNGTPGEDSFGHGVAYQWVYLLAPQDATLTAPNTQYAQWDETMGAWLVGFSIYLWDTTTPSTPYDIEFPEPFIEPVPASNYNPLGL